jgi:uncharacterized protein with HEPN domain
MTGRLMPDRDPVYLAQITQAAGVVRQFIGGMDRAAFLTNRMACDAVTLQVFVVAESVSRLSEATRVQMGHLPWTEIRAVQARRWPFCREI